MIPIHVFHHIPKCAGNSLKVCLAARFILADDYRHRSSANVAFWETEESFRQRRLDLSALGSRHLLLGHFDIPGARLWERYPEVSQSPFRRITFLRDPLDRAVSEFFYAASGAPFERKGETLDAHLSATRNPMASWIAADPRDAPTVLADYWFVGTVEHLRADADRLMALLDRGPAQLMRINDTPRPEYRLDPRVVERFRRANAIDYALFAQALRAGGHLDSTDGVA